MHFETRQKVTRLAVRFAPQAAPLDAVKPGVNLHPFDPTLTGPRAGPTRCTRPGRSHPRERLLAGVPKEYKGPVPHALARQRHPIRMTTRSNPLILVIEDNTDLRETVRDLLESESFACWTAESADDALHQLELGRERPDVVLLDVVMPGMPAVDLVQKLRERPDWDATRIVFMTGLSAHHLPRSVKVDAVVKKPFTPAQLFSTIRALV